LKIRHNFGSKLCHAGGLHGRDRAATGVVRPTLRRRLDDPTVGSEPWLAGDRVWQPGAGRQGKGKHHEHQSQFLCRARGLWGGRFPSLRHGMVFPHQRRSSHQAIRVNSHRPAVAVVTRFPVSPTRLQRQLFAMRWRRPDRVVQRGLAGTSLRATDPPHGCLWGPLQCVVALLVGRVLDRESPGGLRWALLGGALSKR
jgi:hypothetical protein